ncbi:MAG: TrkH family potassium uptake protein [Ehrlichia sp.]
MFSLACVFFWKIVSLKKKEVFIVTSSVWIILSIMSAMPFAFEMKISFTDAFFEAVSGLTTTGATVLTNLQNKSPGVLIWRSLLNAIGGLGIIVTGIFLVPCLKVMSLYELYYSESSDKSKKFKYGIVKSSMYVFIIYCALMTLCAICYWVTGMSGFDAICHAMSTVSTGGFSNYDSSLQYFDNVYVEIVAVVFMLLSSCPFIVYLKIITKQRFYDEQVMSFFIIVCFFSMISVTSCYFDKVMFNYSLFDILRYSIFSVVTLSTSTGFANYDYDNWHFFSVFGVFVMLVGGCSGSTNSGIKVYRIVLLMKALIACIGDFVRPSKVSHVQYSRKDIDNNSICDVGVFFFCIFLFYLWVV